MTQEELKILSVNDIRIILTDQQDLYTPEEISQLQGRLQYLTHQQVQQQPKAKPKEFYCPKCGAPNKAVNIICPYCGYKFNDADYYVDYYYLNNKKQAEDKQETTILYIIAFLLPIVGIILGIVYIRKANEHLGKLLILFSIIMSLLEILIKYIFLF